MKEDTRPPQINMAKIVVGSQAMLISGHKTRAMLERCNIVSLKNIQDAGAKLHAWSQGKGVPSVPHVPVPTA